MEPTILEINETIAQLEIIEGSDAVILEIIEGTDIDIVEVIERGLQGPPGPNGSPGPQGTNVQWIVDDIGGFVSPGDGIGNDGDLFLNTFNGDVYQKSAGSWGLAGNITGPAGPAFLPTTGVRFTQFVSDGIAETVIDNLKTALPLIPDPARTVEQGMAGWWNSTTSRITPELVQDAFRFRLSVFTRPVIPATVPILIVEVDAAASGNPELIVAAEKQSVTSGSFEILTFNFDLHAGTNLFANGAKITLRTVGGNVIIKDPRLLIKEG